MKKLIYGLIIVVLILSVFFIVKYKGKDDYYIVEERTVKKVVYASGVAKPVNYVVVKSEVSGCIKDIYVKENEKVKKGQVLAVIDPGALIYRLKEIQSRLSLVEERLKPNSDYIKALEEDIRRIEAKLTQEKINLERRKALFQKGLIPREQYEMAETNYQLLEREYEKAVSTYKDNLLFLKREREVLINQLQQVRRELEKYYIKSPIDGVIFKKYINVGDYVNTLSQDNKLFSIGNPEKWEIILDVDEEFLNFVKEGMVAHITLDAYPNKTFKGIVQEIIRDIDRGKRVFQVKLYAQLPKETPVNATAEAYIVVYERKAPVIPKEAYRNGKVIKFDGVRLTEVEVKIGLEVDNYLEVLEGLKPGDKIKLKK